MTITREIVKGRDSPVVKEGTREKQSKRESTVKRQVGSDQSPHVEEQSKSKDIVLQ